MPKNKLIPALLVLFFSLTLTPCLSFSSQIVGEEGADSVSNWLPKISGLIRYSAWWPEHTSLRHPETELDRVFLWIDKDFNDGSFGFHFNLQYKYNKQTYYPRQFWIEEGYLFTKTPLGKLKIGSVYTPFGLLWDHTYYGSILYYKGYMCDADYGLVLGDSKALTDNIDLNYSLGYFFREDDLNGATLLASGPEHLTHGERNTFAARLNPEFKLGEDSSLSLGVSALTGEIESSESDRQLAFAGDCVYKVGPLTLTSEYVFYDQNYNDKDSTIRGDMFMVEANLDIYKNPEAKFLKNIAIRYNYSQDYPDQGSGLGRLHLPAISFQLFDDFKMDIIYVDWKAGQSRLDQSWRMIFYLNF